MSHTLDIWDTLELAPTDDTAAIRRAYAAKLKRTNPEDDPQGFQQLRQAFEAALVQPAYLFETGPELAENGDEDADLYDFDVYAQPAQPEFGYTPADAEPGRSPWEAAAEEGEQARLREGFAALHRGLEAGAPVDEPLREILSAAALDQVAVQDQVERHLASVILYYGASADGIIAPVIQRFGWDQRVDDVDLHYDIQSVLQRAATLRFGQELEGGRHPLSAAYRVLRSPPTPLRYRWSILTRRLDKAVGALLAQVRHDHWDLEDQFDAGALAWWDRHLGRPRLFVPLLRLGLVLAPIYAALVALAAAYTETPVGAALAGLQGLGAALGVFALLVAVKFGALDWPAHLWRRRWGWSAPLWARAGWVPLALAPLIACLAPANSVPAWAFAVAALIACCWAALARGGDVTAPRDERWLLRLRDGMILNAPLLFWWLWIERAAPDPRWTQVGGAVSWAVLSFGLGGRILTDLWLVRTAARTRMLVAAAFAAASGVLVYLFVSPEGPGLLGPELAVGFAALLLLHRVFVRGLPQESVKGLRIIVGINFVVLLAANGRRLVDSATPEPFALILGAALLGGVCAMSLYALLMAYRDGRRGAQS